MASSRMLRERLMKRSFCLQALVAFPFYSAFAQQLDNNSVHHSSHAGSQPKPSADEIWASLMAGNARFAAGKTQSLNVVSLRRRLASGQAPDVIILSCSDSRVSPEVNLRSQPRRPVCSSHGWQYRRPSCPWKYGICSGSSS
jgi:hypothetical protein